MNPKLEEKMAKEMKNRSFERALNELEVKVRILNGKEISLEESLNHFEDGVKLVRECQQLLDNAENTMFELAQGSENNQNTVFTKIEARDV